MLLADDTCHFLVESFSLVAIGCLQRDKDAHVTRLDFGRGMVGEMIQRDVVFKTEFQDLKDLVGPKAVINQHS